MNYTKSTIDYNLMEAAARQRFDAAVKVILDSADEILSSDRTNDSDRRNIGNLKERIASAARSVSTCAGFYPDDLDRAEHFTEVTNMIILCYKIGHIGTTTTTLARILKEKGTKQTAKARSENSKINMPQKLIKMKISIRDALDFIRDKQLKTMTMNALVNNIKDTISSSCNSAGVSPPSHSAITGYLRTNPYIASFVI